MRFSGYTPLSSVKTSQLTLQRQDCVLFQPVSFTLKPGDLLWVRGPNGVGKSSLLRALSGLLPTASGKIYWGESTQIPLGNIAYLGHQPGIRNALTVWENLVIDPLLASANSTLLHAIQRYALMNVIETRVYALSRGQCQRVALAKLSQSTAALWILDEPFTALDAQGQAALQADLEAHSEKGGITIIASHHAFSFKYSIQQLDLKDDATHA